jgi:N-acetylneuraminic acid mutarotase
MLFCLYTLLPGQNCEELVWETIPSMPEPKRNFMSVSVGDDIFVFGGSAQAHQYNYNNSAYRFISSTKTWIALKPMPARIAVAGVVSHGDNIYIIGGAGPSYGAYKLNSVYRYSISTDSWETLPSLPTARRQPACTVHDGYIYAAGGGINSWSIGTPTNVVERFNLTTNKWESFKKLPIPLCATIAATSRECIFVMGGHTTGQYVPRGFKYDFSLGEWIEIANQPFITAPAHFTQVVDPSGKIYVFKFFGADEMAVYDPDKDNWCQVENILVSPKPMYHNYGITATSKYIYILGGKPTGQSITDVGERASFGPSYHTVLIDIKPGSDENLIGLKSKGNIPVAIVTTSIADGDAFDFDATTVDPLTVAFGPDSAKECHGKGHIEDFDHDGDLDMLLHFKTQEIGIQSSDSIATLIAMTIDGQAIQGKDNITIIGITKKENIDKSQINTSPSEFFILENYPDPFNLETTIQYSILQNGFVNMDIYNIAGEKIITLLNDEIVAGQHAIIWGGRDQSGNLVSSGMYICKIQMASDSKSIRMLLMK